MATSNSRVGKPERATQDRIVKLFRDELGYIYLGDWTERENNNNIESEMLTAYLAKNNYSGEQISRALDLLERESQNFNRSLYASNLAVYSLLRYGVQVQTEAGHPFETIKLINWENPEANDFSIAKEVTLQGNHERRPDFVLYINGIAIGVIELKNSRVSVGDGIRQLISNQRPEFNERFFSTVQFVFAGNDTEGLKYGTIGTKEKYFLTWKEDKKDNKRFKLDKYLMKICNKDRLAELIHDFVVFDDGVKKLPRVHQYFGVKKAQDRVKNKEGGIIWNTQGSGKSITMVLLAKWILENNSDARVAIITDRDELDRQIEGVFKNVGEEINRTKSGRDLMNQLGQATPRLLCSLVHKFGRRNVDDFDQYIKDLAAQPTQTVGEIYVFVDECHRTQSGKLHKMMKTLLPNAVFIGFTGTPLLKQDKATSLEVFGSYIHTYKFSEAVEDQVVLDLIYEARDIDQDLTSEEKIDAWFEVKTKALNDWQRDELKKKWGTMKSVLSSLSRMEKVVADIIFDFGVKPRLNNDRGTAILVATSVFEACKYYSLFQKTEFKNQIGIITSYNPQTKDVTLEDTGANNETDKEFIYNTYQDLLSNAEASSARSKTEAYEEKVKSQFINEPANMKLLIVVNKLLTGFDAPSCTYLYIDKSMRNHGLFQAICRTNRLDGDDKDFGYIVDYMDLFKKLVNEKGTGALQVYSSELDHAAEGPDPDVLMQTRLKKGKEKLDAAIEAIELICEPIKGKDELECIHHFCGNTEIPTDLQEREPQRAALYKSTATVARAYANIKSEMNLAGYSEDRAAVIKNQVQYYVRLRDTIKNASGETLDLKAYEADMRHLIDTYIQASEPTTVSPFGDMPLLDLIVKSGIGEAINTKLSSLKNNDKAVAETIENNVRKKIVTERASNPELYDRMSQILDEIITNRKSKALEYQAYLRQIVDLVKKVQAGHEDSLPDELDTPGKRALYDNLGKNLELALKVHNTVKRKAPDGFRGVPVKEKVVKGAIFKVLNDIDEVERIFAIIFTQEEY